MNTASIARNLHKGNLQRLGTGLSARRFNQVSFHSTNPQSTIHHAESALNHQAKAWKHWESFHDAWHTEAASRWRQDLHQRRLDRYAYYRQYRRHGCGSGVFAFAVKAAILAWTAGWLLDKWKAEDQSVLRPEIKAADVEAK